MKNFKKGTYYKSSNNCSLQLWGAIRLCKIYLFGLAIANFLLMPVALADTKLNTTVLFQPPPEEERPEETEGAASRQNRVCLQDVRVAQKASSDRAKLTAIVPERNYGLTVAERPIFWVYLPQTSARQAILSIREEGKTPHWQQSVELRQPGIMGIKLSENASALETGKNYQWAVILVCGNKPHPNDPVVTAWIKRIDEFTSSHSSSSKLEQASFYARQGIWYDALDSLVAAKNSSTDKWNDIWIKYLQSGGLDEIANEPVN